jgi:twitching motility two-component system response regulator PilG
MGDTRGNDSLERGIETAKAGNKLLARLHLLQAVELSPRDPNCWLWLAWVAESPASAMHSLQRVLDDNPSHELALLGLRWAKAMAEFDLHAQPSVSEEPELGFAEPVEQSHESTEPSSETVESKFAGESEGFSNTTERQAEGTERGHFGSSEGEHKDDEQKREENADWSQADSESQNAPVSEGRFEQEGGYPQGAVSTRRDDMETWAVLEREEASGKPAEERLDWFEEDESSESETRSREASASTPGGAEPGASDDRNAESNSSDETVEAPNWWQASETIPAVPSKTLFAEAPETSRAEQEAESRQETVAQVQPYEKADEAEPVAVESPAEEFSNAEDGAVVEKQPESDPGVTVLVVDDSPTVRKLVTMTLEKNGFTVASAPDGVVALKSIAELKPRLILLDITMPRLGGYQLCKLIKKHESTRHIPVIMLSGKDGMFDKVRGKFVGCDDYITKPFDPDVLVEKVSSQLTEHYGALGARS